MVKTKDDLYVYAEGGGSGANSSSLQSEFRQAFAGFFAKTDLGTSRRPRVVACGSRRDAFDNFCTALAQGQNALLLVDAEAPVTAPDTVWQHLHKRDGWPQPTQAVDADGHLMVECMENWFLADWETVAAFFGQGFRTQDLPPGNCETIAKHKVYSTLATATKNCKPKGVYSKGAHSFKLLGKIDPAKVEAASPWAKRFLDEIRKRKP